MPDRGFLHLLSSPVLALAMTVSSWGHAPPTVAANAPPVSVAAAPSPQVLEQAGLGRITVLAPADSPKGLVLLLAPAGTQDENRRARLHALADAIVALDYVVASIDSDAALFQPRPANAGANDAVARLQALGAQLQSRYQLQGSRPVLTGTGSGAALVYHLLAAAAPGIFHAGISLDFCPAASDGAAPPATRLATTWFVFQHAPACDAQDAARFVRAVGNARLDTSAAETTADSAAGSAPQPWAPALSILQWLDPANASQFQSGETISGVPLIEIPAKRYHNGGRMVVFLSGDGGWAELDQTVAAQLSDFGFAVLGWDSLSYFWNAKTPEQAGKDLERVLRHYQQQWQPDKIALVGYSFGANVLPFMASRLPDDLRARIDHIVLLSPEARASFEFHLSNWISSPTENTVPLLPELARLRWTRILCLYGDEEEDTDVCPSFATQGVSVAALPGDHHFNEDYVTLARRIVANWPR